MHHTLIAQWVFFAIAAILENKNSSGKRLRSSTFQDALHALFFTLYWHLGGGKSNGFKGFVPRMEGLMCENCNFNRTEVNGFVGCYLI